MPDYSNLVVVTDLDGTLLDHDSYSFEAAEPALRDLRARRIPVVCSSSKTRDEILYWRKRLWIDAPFICENGAAVFLPKDQFPDLPRDLQSTEGLLVKPFGTGRDLLLPLFESVRADSGVDMTGFSDMDVLRIKILCGFGSDEEARLAAERQYSEPFVFGSSVSDSQIEDIIQRFSASGCRVIRGRRFYHLVGNTDKGVAVDFLRDAYSHVFGKRPVFVGIGDSKNDIELLKAVDLPFLVMGKNRRYDPVVKEQANTRLAGAQGPEGWRRAIRSVLSNTTD